jgi:hypothetical protein
MEEEGGYITGRAWLYFCNKNSGHLSADRWGTHSAGTNFFKWKTTSKKIKFEISIRYLNINLILKYLYDIEISIC